MTSEPGTRDNPLWLLLKDREVEELNRRRAAGEPGDLVGCDLGGLDLRALEADGLDLRDSCLDHTDLRGVDLRGARLEGATIHAARIAGAYFPADLPAEEIELALLHGTRLRPRP
jgi:uncharacterized protein YjbI with pentapeptide repeats